MHDLCDICGHDRNQPDLEPLLDELRKLGMNVIVEHPDGSRLLHFEDRSRLRIIGDCNACDAFKLEQFITLRRGLK